MSVSLAQLLVVKGVRLYHDAASHLRGGDLTGALLGPPLQSENEHE